MVLFSSFIILIANISDIPVPITLGQKGEEEGDILCKRCIIFRMDDAQDYSFQPGALGSNGSLHIERCESLARGDNE